MFRDMSRYGRDPHIVQRSKTTFADPLKWAADPDGPRLVFTCSWSDFFIEEADEWRNDALNVIRDTPEIFYQILTKRPERLADFFPKYLPNVLVGVSVESREQLWRVTELLRWWEGDNFISAEPLIGEVRFGPLLNYIHWVIVGGESGPQARPMKEAWVSLIYADCEDAGTPFFFKQWGGNKKQDGVWGGREWMGQTWDEMPFVLQ